VPYSTAAQIESMFKDVNFGNKNSKVTSAEVGVFITEADALIDSYVGQKYVVPVTGTSSLALMQKLSRMLVTHQVKLILQTKDADPEVNQSTHGGTLESQALKVLKAIAEGTAVLSDATPVDSGGGVASYNVTNSIDYTFKVDTDQW
jgi:phage gp36-like protein